MASRMLDEVLAAEKNATAATAQASEKADAALENARAEQLRIISDKKKAAQSQASEAIEAAEAKAKAIELAAAEKAGGEAEKINAVARTKSDAAVAALIKQII